MSKTMKRYVVFAWMWYESGGGWNDFHGDYDFLADAELAVKSIQNDPESSDDCQQIVDLQTGEIISEEIRHRTEQDV